MEIDSDSYVTVMSKETKDRLFLKLAIKKFGKWLNRYGNVELEHSGVVDDLEVEYRKEQEENKTRASCHETTRRYYNRTSMA